MLTILKKIIPLLILGAFAVLPASAQKWSDGGDSAIYTVPRDPDAVRIRPYLSLKIGYDSNVLLDESAVEQDDTFGEARIGLGIRKPIGLLDLGVNGSVTTEKYSDVSEADDTDWNLDLNLGLNTDEDYFIGSRDTVELKFDVDVNAGERVNDETGRLEDSRRLGASINAGKTLDNIFGDVDLNYSFENNDFDNSDGYSRHGLQGSVASILDPNTAITFTSSYYYDDSENDTNDGATWDNQVGLRKILTAKTQIAASVGYATSEIGDADTISYNVNGTWLATDKTKINLTGRSSLRASTTQNDTASIQNDGKIEVLLAHSDTLTSRISVNLTKIELESGSNNEQDAVNQEDAGDLDLRFFNSGDSDTITYIYDLVYGPRDLNYNLFWETEYRVREGDETTNEYDNFLTSVGILLHY